MYLQTNLSNDQILEVRPSTVYAILFTLKYFLFSLVVFSAGVYFVDVPIPYFFFIVSFVAVIALITGIYNYFYIRYTVFIISSDQIKTMTGVFSRRIDFLEMYRIKDFIVNQSFIFRLLNIMTFTLLSVDKNANNAVITMKGIPVTALPDKVRDLVQRARQSNRVFEVDNGI